MRIGILAKFSPVLRVRLERYRLTFPAMQECILISGKIPNMLRELNQRSNGGITVSLLWDDSAKINPKVSEFQVRVSDDNGNRKFVFRLDNFEDAKEAYFHPYASRNLALKTGKIAA
jgi:hypothetical protein